MFILNSKDMTNLRRFNKETAEWLIANKIPVLSIEKNDYVFANTRALNIMLNKLPSNLKGGEIIG